MEFARSDFLSKIEVKGSVRVCYTDFAEYEVIYLITAFQKKSQENLTEEEKSILKKLVKSLREEAAKKRR